MNYRSTRGKSEAVALSEAIETGLAPDGGLYVPESFPTFAPGHFDGALDVAGIAERLLAPFFGDDPILSPQLGAIARRALDFPLPLNRLRGGTELLELFHGPTAAFKDVGARFLAECFARIPSPRGAGLRTILVATSGDTGGAVASAFYGKPGIEVAVLFPEGGVSPLQQRQLTCWGGNVRSFAVRGSFDDCQRLVKEAFAARGTGQAIPGRHLTSANSINIGRLLPQCVYYAASSLEHFRETGREPGFVIPSGNVGNAMAALWAMKTGLPIREACLATNANQVVPEYLRSGVFRPAESVRTLANAMDVGNPSNLERLIDLLDQAPELRSRLQAVSVSDGELRSAIRKALEDEGEILCPHTAAAYHAKGALPGSDWIVVATAHPAKFNEVVAPLAGRPAEAPPALTELMRREPRFEKLEPRLAALREALAS